MEIKRRKICDQARRSSSSEADVHTVPIRTLCVGGIKPDMNEQIKMYFERFGTVNSVEIQHENYTNYGLVEFESVKAAAAVLSSKRLHRIDGHKVQVKAAEPWQQPDQILNALNNDCLRAILMQLNLCDLTSAANACVRFNEQAKSIFSTKFKKKLALTDGCHKVAKVSLQTFGSLAQSVDLNGLHRTLDNCTKRYQLKTEFLSMINQYCTSQLKDLKFCNYIFKGELFDDRHLSSVWNTIETLSFNGCTLQNSFNVLLSACAELKVLHIDCCDLRNVKKFKLDKALPKLEELRLASSPIDVRFINGIIRSESKLKKFALVDYSGNTNAWNATRVIAQHCTNLLELELKLNFTNNVQYAESVHRLHQITSLEVLKFDLSWRSIELLSTLLTSNAAPIEHLKLENGNIVTGTIEAISQMKHLKVLELCNIDSLTDKHMIKLAQLSSKLEKLRLDGFTADNLTTVGLKKALPFATKLSLLTLESETITIDADDYKEMLRTLQKRPEKVKLMIECKEGTIEVGKQVQKENRDWFQIDGNFTVVSY